MRRMITPRYLAGFTGHRQLDNPDAVRTALAAELASLKTRIEQAGGILEFYSSAAYGADTIACEEAESLGIPVHIILPKPVVFDPETGELDRKEGFAADFWKDGTFLDDEWRSTYNLIQTAESGVKGGTLRLTTGSLAHPECYYDTGLQMLEAIDVLIAVWDGQPARGLGGTQHFVSLADKAQMPSIIISPAGDKVERPDLDKLAVIDESRKLIQLVDEFSQRYQSNDTKLSEADALFQRLDTCSDLEAKDFRKGLVRIIKAHAFATLVAAIAALLPSEPSWKIFLGTLATLELCLVGWAIWRSRQLTHHHGTHERWMQTRFAAEIMRAIRDSCGLLDPLHPLIARHQPQWRRFAVTVGLLIQRDQRPKSWTSARSDYLEKRLFDPKDGQIPYFSIRHALAVPHFHKALRWGKILGWAALIFVSGAVIVKCCAIADKFGIHYLHTPDPISKAPHNAVSWLFDIAFKFLPIALPLLSGMFIALRTALDSSRRSYRYSEVAQRLTAAATTLETLQTEAAVRRTVTATEEILLDELVEWHLAEQQNGAH
jgi:hypothetical protein